MRDVEFVLALVAVSAALRVVSLRFAIPYVPALVVAGVGIALIPGVPSARVSPEVVFLVAVPLLLFRAAESVPLRDLRREFLTILQFGVILVLVSIVAVASIVVVKTAAGVALGLPIGWLSLFAHRISGSRPALVCTMCLLPLYAAFMTAEAVNAAGVPLQSGESRGLCSSGSGSRA
jgi:NhaP-type Na+/H+ or K+/H+ antiporter